MSASVYGNYPVADVCGGVISLKIGPYRRFSHDGGLFRFPVLPAAGQSAGVQTGTAGGAPAYSCR